MTCPACGAPAAPEARFCASCGLDLRRRGDERRVATILFADLVGFTTLSETRDPESVKNLVDRCFERLVADIDAYGGRVDKIIGDAIVALFGAPVAHEDDAERAVRAGLQMQRTLEAWAESEGADVLRMRVGVNTGEVLVGAFRAGGDYTAMGDVVNTASRLQTAASPGQVLVGAATYAATRHCVRYTEFGHFVAKGREEPVEAWVAEEALLPPGARPNRGRTPLVGRDPELGLLRHAVDASVARKRAQLLLLIGDAGMGKTRLAEETAEDAACRHDALVLEGRCVPYGEANVWWPVAEALRAGCGISPNDDAAVARASAHETVRSVFVDTSSTDAEVERVTNGLLHLMGYEGPLQDIDTTRAREEMVRSLLAFVEAATRQRPMVVVLSDLHWADDIVLERMDQLLERVATQPFVLIATARHALLERWTPAPGRHNTVSLTLDPLDREATGALLDALAEGELPADLRQVLLDRSGGNPFFAEELVALLSEAGMVGGPGRGVVGAADLPDTLRGLVAARLDALTVGERLVLEDAAVIGRRGTTDALRIMAAEAHNVSDIDDVLSGLVAKDVLVIEDGKWSFRSDLVREVSYGTMTKADRARRHYGIAKWLEHHISNNPADVDRIAHHFALAARLTAEIGGAEGPASPAELTERALHWLDKAVTQAEAGELYVVAAQLCTQALELGDAVGPASRMRFLLARSRALTHLRELESAQADLDSAMQDATASGDAKARAEVLLGRGDVEQKAGDLEASLATLAAAIAEFRALGDIHGTAEALRAHGMTLMFADRNDGAEEAFTEALELYRQTDDRRGEAWALQNLAWLAFSLGRADEADDWLQQSAATFSAIGDAGGLGWALGLLAWVRYHQGRYDEAERLAEQMLSEARQRGDRWASGMMLVLVASLRLWTGRTDEALEPAAEARTLFEEMADWYGHGNALGVLARCMVASGRVEEGFGLLEEASRSAQHSDDRWASMVSIVTAAQVGLPDRASHLFATPDDLPGAPGEIGFTDAHVATGILHLQLGDTARAREFVERAVERAESFAPFATAALALVRAACGDTAAAAMAAESVESAAGATYADRSLATTARGLALAQDGDGPGAKAALASAREAVDATADKLTQALVRLAEAEVLTVIGDDRAATAADEADRRLDAIGLTETAWRRAFTLAASPDEGRVPA